MNKPMNVTAVRSDNPRVTLTQFTHFLLASDKAKPRIVAGCFQDFDFNPYWSPMRNAIARAHNSFSPNHQELVSEALKQSGEKLENYLKAAKSYTLASVDTGLHGNKIRRLRFNGFKPEVEVGGLTISVNPETVLKGDLVYIQKLYFGKMVPMTDIVAQQVLAIIDWSIRPDDDVKILLTDVWSGKVFQGIGDQKAALERFVINCRSFVKVLDTLEDQSGAA